MTVSTLATAGGLFAIFVFVHFVVDWVFQTHDEAMAKSTNWKVRARHCAIYTLGFFPVMYFLGFSPFSFIIGSAVLFFSHFVEDTYYPVFLWAKYVRKIPWLNMIDFDTGKPVPKEVSIENFKGEFAKPLSLLLFIAIDQIIHISFLWVLVVLAMI